MNCSFKLNHYEKTLEEFVKNGFVSITLDQFFKKDYDLDPHKKYFVMRHDIDHDITLLEDMLFIENKVGIKSSNYFRARAKNYNIFSRQSSSIIQRAVSLGHSVGFHYEDIDLENDRIKFIIEALRREHGDHTFQTVSPHEPTRAGTQDDFDWKSLGVLGDAYDKDLMSFFKYISDSSCRWREGCMHNFVKHPSSMYVLTHPIWWYKEHPGENY